MVTNINNKGYRARRRRKKFHRSIEFIFILMVLVIGMLMIYSYVKSKNISFPFINRYRGNNTSGTDYESNIKILSPEEMDTDKNKNQWNLILINKYNYIPNNYKLELIELSNGERIDKRIYPELQEMFDDMRSDGIYPFVRSGYRTAEEQQAIMDDKIEQYKSMGYSAEEAKEYAMTCVAAVGTSEHQLGIAVDINADGYNSTAEEVYEWLYQNSYKYGFIKRYATDKIEITKTIDEPWHFRYVGVDAATEMFNQNLCLEEYLAKKK